MVTPSRLPGYPVIPPWGRLDIPPQESADEEPPKRSAQEIVKEAIKNGRWEFPRTNKDGSVDGRMPRERPSTVFAPADPIGERLRKMRKDNVGATAQEEPPTQHAFQVIKSGSVILDEFAILKIPYTQKVRIDRKDYFQGIRNGVQRRFLCDESRYHYFPTWQGAWAHLCALAQAEVTAAESALAHAKETLAAAKAMRPDW
jgi:hypothetical protein